jgi:mono/diheme cytochrome c family protein
MGTITDRGTSSMSDPITSPQEAAPLHGILAEYDTPTALVLASRKVRDAGFSRWDTYTPFPIHGIDKAMGIKMTILPWIVMVASLLGLGTAVWFQWWTNAVDYPWIVSGKPFWSWPANVPIMFEMTVLFSAFAALAGMLVLNNLPLPSHPLDLKERFARASDDKFFLLIQASDPKFDEADIRQLLAETTPAIIEDVPEDRVTSDQIPRSLVYIGVLSAFVSLVPFAFFAKARTATTETGRFHLVWDMDFSPAYKAQETNPLFEDQRAMRQAPSGTVAVGNLQADDHMYQGKTKAGVFVSAMPKGLTVDADLMALGKEQFGIYCAPCHGLTGDGNGMVHKRAEAIGGGWVPPSNLHQEYIRQMPAGQLFDVITNGVRNMPSYSAQIEPEERWAIILYVRALQKSQGANVSDLSEADRALLK